MIDSDFVGIPYIFYGDDFKGTNCLGLCRLFYKEHGWPENFLDGKPITKDWQERDRTRLIRYLRDKFDETKDVQSLEYGDLILFEINGDYHMGIVLDYGDVLSMQVPCIEGQASSTIYHRRWWTPFFRRGFKRRKV